MLVSSIDQSTLFDNELPKNTTQTKYVYFETDSKDIAKIKISAYTKDVTDEKTTVKLESGEIATLYKKNYYINLK